MPRPRALSIRSSPCISSTSRRDSTRPMPVPSIFECSAPRRLNGSNSRSSFSGVMPMPSSAMRRAQRSSSTCQLTRTWPPGRLYLTALLSRLTSTWRRRTRSARTKMSAPATSPRDPKPPSSPEIQVLTPTLVASGTTIESASSTEERRSTDSSVTVIWPDSTLDRSSTSLTSASRCAPAFSMCWMRASCCSDGGSAVSSRSSWEKPRTALSGVRSSWLMRDRNSVFARLDASSASRAWRSARAVCRPVTSRRTAVRSGPRSVSWRERETSSGNSWPSARRPNSSRTSPLWTIADLQRLGPGGFRGARMPRDEAVDRAADRLGRRRPEQALGRAVEEHDPAVGVDRDDAVVDGVDQAGHADLALAQRGLHVQPLGDVEERRHRALQHAVVPHRMRPVLDREASCRRAARGARRRRAARATRGTSGRCASRRPARPSAADGSASPSRGRAGPTRARSRAWPAPSG